MKGRACQWPPDPMCAPLPPLRQTKRIVVVKWYKKNPKEKKKGRKKKEKKNSKTFKKKVNWEKN